MANSFVVKASKIISFFQEEFDDEVPKNVKTFNFIPSQYIIPSTISNTSNNVNIQEEKQSNKNSKKKKTFMNIIGSGTTSLLKFIFYKDSYVNWWISGIHRKIIKIDDHFNQNNWLYVKNYRNQILRKFMCKLILLLSTIGLLYGSYYNICNTQLTSIGTAALGSCILIYFKNNEKKTISEEKKEIDKMMNNMETIIDFTEKQ